MINYPPLVNPDMPHVNPDLPRPMPVMMPNNNPLLIVHQMPVPYWGMPVPSPYFPGPISNNQYINDMFQN
ncbi:hypothetical protein JYU34_000268 [Plutella xylostella]|uniref:Uncharacterized protein n=1 Tax=Plutella xylostella TaxID=51655 RepID=A0ABQ7R7A3_PLUXY|nr:hypothetical protein JYU34_000268 [Plutella xylostella]